MFGDGERVEAELVGGAGDELEVARPHRPFPVVGDRRVEVDARKAGRELHGSALRVGLGSDGLHVGVEVVVDDDKTIDILIFRLDRGDLARALEAAVARGVMVRALTAHTNRGGEKHLRKLELQLLEGGVTVSRTADDLVRYHGKMMIVDGRMLHVYGFNFTTLDIDKSRSFGVITRNRRLVQEALKLFEADFDRQPYTSSFNGSSSAPRIRASGSRNSSAARNVNC